MTRTMVGQCRQETYGISLRWYTSTKKDVSNINYITCIYGRKYIFLVEGLYMYGGASKSMY